MRSIDYAFVSLSIMLLVSKTVSERTPIICRKYRKRRSVKNAGFSFSLSLCFRYKKNIRGNTRYTRARLETQDNNALLK